MLFIQTRSTRWTPEVVVGNSKIDECSLINVILHFITGSNETHVMDEFANVPIPDMEELRVRLFLYLSLMI